MNGTGNLGRNGANSVPRYRFTDEDGRAYAPFRLKAGVTVSQIIQQAFPGDAQDTDWSIEKA